MKAPVDTVGAVWRLPVRPKLKLTHTVHTADLPRSAPSTKI